MDRYSWRVLLNDLLLKQQQIHSVKNRLYYLCFVFKEGWKRTKNDADPTRKHQQTSFHNYDKLMYQSP